MPSGGAARGRGLGHRPSLRPARSMSALSRPARRARAPLLVTGARWRASAAADLVRVVGAPLVFRLGYGEFAGGAVVCQLTDSPAELASHVDLAGSASGDLTLALDGLVEAWQRQPGQASYADWVTELRDTADAATAADASILDSAADPIHPARVYRELNRQLSEDT